MRQINEIIVHCTDTPADWWKSKSTKAKVNEVRRWHTQQNGWNDIGYHYLIDRDGTVAKGREDSVTGAHVKGHNSDTIGISLFGGKSSTADDTFHDNFTALQNVALRKLINELQEKYGPGLKVSGHNEYANKACPGFRVRPWLNGRPDRQPVSKRTTGAVGIAGATAMVTQAETLVQSAAGIADSVGLTEASASPQAEHANGLVLILAVALVAALGWLIYTRIKDTGRVV
jgi:hypothetical protein